MAIRVIHAGRNDKCPCGSGKKYKKCCYDKDQPLTLAQKIRKRYDELEAEIEQAKKLETGREETV